MNVIIPLTMIEDYLLGCNVPENEKTEWADGGFDAVNSTNRNTIAICCSTSGTLWKAVYAVGVYYSTDSGVTWTAWSSYSAGTGAKNWGGICALGTNIYISVTGGSIWLITAEAGTCTDLAQTTRNWYAMDTCPNGHVWAIVQDGASTDVYKQTSGAGNFAKDCSARISTASYGLHITSTDEFYVSCLSGTDHYIAYRSSSAASFADLSGTVAPASIDWRGGTSNSDGDIFFAANNGSIYIRSGGTGNFTSLAQKSRAWRDLCHDASYNIFGVVYGGLVYKADGFQMYAKDDYCQVTTGTNLSDHKIYESLTDNNIGNDPTTDAVNWTLIGNTNRTKIFDQQLWDQTVLAGLTITYCFFPGYTGIDVPDAVTPEVDAIALLNIESGSVQIIEIDYDEDVLDKKGLWWDNATGTTEPDGWDKVGTPSDFTLNTEDNYYSVQVTSDAAGEGISYTATVTAATEYQLILVYKNTTGDVAQFAVYDVTHSADIKATTDLTDSTVFTVLSYVFTTPAGCTSIKLSLLNKNSGDIITWKFAALAPTIYNETTVTSTLINTLTTTSLTKEKEAIYTVILTKTTPPEIGEIVLGEKYDIAGRAPNFGLSWGIKDWSTIEADTYGHYSIVEREQSKWMKGSIEIASTDFDYVSNLLTYYTNQYLMWIGSETNQCQMIYGFCDDWSFQQDEYSNAVLNFSIAGLT